VAFEGGLQHQLLLTDMDAMFELMKKNIALNDLGSHVVPLILNWYVHPLSFPSKFLLKYRGEPLPERVVSAKPNVILAADCVYFEPAFPLLLQTLGDLLELCQDAVIYFCFKKRRRADMHFMKNAKKKFVVEEIEDQDREVFSREGLFLYTFKRKS
jgi:hypothetical protein